MSIINNFKWTNEWTSKSFVKNVRSFYLRVEVLTILYIFGECMKCADAVVTVHPKWSIKYVKGKA